MELKGNTFTALNVKFPDDVANIFHHTLFSLNEDTKLLSFKPLKEGLTIFTWNMNTRKCTDVLSVEPYTYFSFNSFSSNVFSSKDFRPILT